MRRSDIYFPKFTGTIYELLSAPVSAIEMVVGYVGAAATKSIVLGLIILATSAFFVPLHIEHPFVDAGLPDADQPDLQPVRLHHRHLGQGVRTAQLRPGPADHAADLPRRLLLFDHMLPKPWQTISLFNPVVYLISGFRWSFFGKGDVSIGVSLGVTLFFLLLCLGVVAWIFKTGWRLKN